MQKYRVETIYENNMKDFVLLCNVLLHGQTIHGLGVNVNEYLSQVGTNI